ncbi:MAG: alpha/beta hydrolase [Cumulibacter sp.]
MPLNPEVEGWLAAMAEAGAPPTAESPVPLARAATEAFGEMQGEAEEVANVENRTVPGPDGAIPVRIYTPTTDGPRSAIIYYHGGGWVIGDLETVDKPCRTLANRTGAVVVSVDYRLAPEHAAPAAFDDCYAATAWVADNAADLGIDPAKIVVSGDSAGGNLAAAVSLAARDRKGPQIAGQALIYPVTNYDWSSPSLEENGDGYLLTRSSMQWFWAHYLGAADPTNNPYVVPARAESFADLPPAYVGTCEFDPLRDEGEAYAGALRDAGVEVTAKRYDGMIHGVFWLQGAVPSAKVLMDDVVDFVHGVTK